MLLEHFKNQSGGPTLAAKGIASARQKAFRLAFRLDST
jgi:hypothetical protein